MTTTLFADQIKNVSYANGVLRITLARQTGENQSEDAGLLVLPITQAAHFANSLNNSLKQLEAKVREAREQQQSSQPSAEGGELNFSG